MKGNPHTHVAHEGEGEGSEGEGEGVRVLQGVCVSLWRDVLAEGSGSGTTIGGSNATMMRAQQRVGAGVSTPLVSYSGSGGGRGQGGAGTGESPGSVFGWESPGVGQGAAPLSAAFRSSWSNLGSALGGGVGSWGSALESPRSMVVVLPVVVVAAQVVNWHNYYTLEMRTWVREGLGRVRNWLSMRPSRRLGTVGSEGGGWEDRTTGCDLSAQLTEIVI